MPQDLSLQRATENILTRSLSLREGQNLLIFAEQPALEVVETIARAAQTLGIFTSVIYSPIFAQTDMRPGESLPLPVEAAVREADAVLSCLSDRPEHMAYRLRVLRTAWSRRTKLANAPGLTAAILRAADIDYTALAENAGLLALALLLSRYVELLTYDSRGKEYRLEVVTGGWNYPPAINDGIIPAGAWANLPPGEVYVVPADANGQVVINGSVPGRVIEPGHELTVTLRNGRVTEIEPASSPAMTHLYHTQIAFAQKQGDDNWSNLAELGFGLNPAIRSLTGAPLSDEKKANTVHIALGHSASLGGDVESVIHADLVIERPTVRIGGRPVLQRGEWCMTGADWRLDHRSAAPAPGWWETVVQVQRSGARADREGGRLVCAWNAGRGRWDSAPVGNEQTSRLAARVYDLLPNGGAAVGRDDLLREAARSGLKASALPGLLWVMRQYDLVKFPGEGPS